MNRPALFIIDMLNDCFIHEQLIEQRATLCERINDLVNFARDNKFHIVWVRQEFEDRGSRITTFPERRNEFLFLMNHKDRKTGSEFKYLLE